MKCRFIFIFKIKKCFRFIVDFVSKMFSFHFLVISVYVLQKLAKNFKWQFSATKEEYENKTDVQNFF